MTGSFRIRAARAEDISAVAQAHQKARLAAYRGMVPDAYLDSLTAEMILDSWRETFRDAKAICLAESNGRILGVVRGGPERTGDTLYTGELYSLHVDPETQKKGWVALFSWRWSAVSSGRAMPR